MKTELRRCRHCGRNQHHTMPYCSWCHRRIYTRKQTQIHRIMDTVIFTIVMVSLVTLIWRLM